MKAILISASFPLVSFDLFAPQGMALEVGAADLLDFAGMSPGVRVIPVSVSARLRVRQQLC